MLVAHGWNVDYSVESSDDDRKYCSQERGKRESGGGFRRARCWVLRERARPHSLAAVGAGLLSREGSDPRTVLEPLVSLGSE